MILSLMITYGMKEHFNNILRTIFATFIITGMIPFELCILSNIFKIGLLLVAFTF